MPAGFGAGWRFRDAWPGAADTEATGDGCSAGRSARGGIRLVSDPYTDTGSGVLARERLQLPVVSTDACRAMRRPCREREANAPLARPFQREAGRCRG